MHAWAEEVHSRLIRMACSLLYRQAAGAGELNSKPSLDLEQLYLMGGVETICSEVIICKPSSPPIRLYAYRYIYRGLLNRQCSFCKQPQRCVVQSHDLSKFEFHCTYEESKVSKLDHVTHLSGHLNQCVVNLTILYTCTHTSTCINCIEEIVIA